MIEKNIYVFNYIFKKRTLFEIVIIKTFKKENLYNQLKIQKEKDCPLNHVKDCCTPNE